MTKSEYVRVSAQEKVFGDNHLLQSQLELLSLVQSFKKYKELRLNELTLKVGLKAKLEELKGLVESLENMLPMAGYHEERQDKTEHKVEKRKENLGLQEEIERIRRKIARLQGAGI